MATWAWALDLQPTDKDGGPNPAAVPVTDVLGASVRYGKSGDALAYAGGSMVLSLDNSSGTGSQYTPGAGGAYSNAEFLGKVCRLTANVTGAGAPSWTHGEPAVFSGVVTDIAWEFDNRFESVMTITVSDALTMLGTLSFAEVDSGNGLDIAAGTAEAALNAILTAANNISSQITQTAIVNPSGDAGKSMQAVTDYTGTAGEILRLVEVSDGGDVFVRHSLPIDGTTPWNALCFRTRGQQTISNAVTGVTGLYPLNLWDESLASSGDEPHTFARIDFASGATASYSQVEFTREGGTTQKASVSAANLDAFGARSLARSGLLTLDDTATLDLANAFLNQYGVGVVPPLATRGIQLPPISEGENDGYELVKYGVGDSCSINFRPDGASATITINGVISGVQWKITPGSATMTVSLEDGDQTVAFVLDSATFGVLDQNRLG